MTPAFTSSARLGQWAVGGWLINNNVHNAAEAGPQTLYANSPGSWWVVADHSRSDVRPGSIKSYPCTQRNFDKPIDSFTAIDAVWSMTCPPVGEWNAAFDVWINGFGRGSTAEIMLWTDHRFPASIPPKNIPVGQTARPTIAGHTFRAWWREAHPGGRYIALVMDRKTPAGEVDLLAVFRWLVAQGWVKGSDKVSAIEYGVEIASTPAGAPQVFRLNKYTLSAR